MFFTVYDLEASFVGKSFCSWSRTRLVTTKLSSERFCTFSSEGRRKKKWGKNKREQKEQELARVPEKKRGEQGLGCHSRIISVGWYSCRCESFCCEPNVHVSNNFTVEYKENREYIVHFLIQTTRKERELQTQHLEGRTPGSCFTFSKSRPRSTGYSESVSTRCTVSFLVRCSLFQEVTKNERETKPLRWDEREKKVQHKTKKPNSIRAAYGTR